MAGRWETHRGDEWWYSDYWCKLDAGFNTAYPGTLSIDRAEFKGQLTEDRLHNLLWLTRQQFKDNVIEVCGLSELSPALHSLQRRWSVTNKAARLHVLQMHPSYTRRGAASMSS